MNESALHNELKELYCKSGFAKEEEVLGYIVDLKKDQQIIEIQTGNFASIKKKIATLVAEYKVLIVYPIAKEKKIIKLNTDGEILSQRKSPKKGDFYHVFNELVYLNELLVHANLAIEVVLTKEKEIRIDDGLGSWRRKGVSIVEHHLVGLEEKLLLNSNKDYLDFIPQSLATPFTNKELASCCNYPLTIARKMTYTLRQMGLLELAKKKGNTNYYTIKR